MALTLPSRALIDALAQRGILAPKANAIRREGTNMNSAHEDVPKFEPPDPGMEPPPLYGRALLDSMPTLGAGFGPSLAMSPAPRRTAEPPSLSETMRNFMAERSAPTPPMDEPPQLQGRYSPAFLDVGSDASPDELSPLDVGASALPGLSGVPDPFIEQGVFEMEGDSQPTRLMARRSAVEAQSRPESLDQRIMQATTRYDRTGDPEDLNTLGALLKVREQDSKASGGLSFEERLALKEAEPPGLAEGRRTNAEIQKSKLKFSEEQQKFLNDLRAKKADQQRVESQMRLIEAQADDARWKIENSDDDQEVQRAAQMLRGLVGYRNEIMSVLQGTQAPTGGEEPKPGAPAGQKPTGAPAAKKGQPTQADYQKAEAEINAKNPGLSDSERLDAILDLLEEQGFSVFDNDEPDS